MLIAVVSLEVNEVISAGESVLARPPARASDAVDALFDIYLRHSLYYLSKEMWRAAMSMSILHPDSPLGRHYGQLDEKLCQQVCRLLTKLRQQGSIDTAVDTEVTGRILFNTMNMSFMTFVKDDKMDVETVIGAVRRQSATMMAPGNG